MREKKGGRCRRGRKEREEEDMRGSPVAGV